ncbi:Uncharacterised protein [Chlamydia trachomatis]|nr:Uncharacterised protein [Chlamydia trachomatis]
MYPQSGVCDWLTQVLQILEHFVTQYKESHFAISLPFTGRIVNTRKPSMPGDRAGFPNFSFSLEGKKKGVLLFTY